MPTTESQAGSRPSPWISGPISDRYTAGMQEGRGKPRAAMRAYRVDILPPQGRVPFEGAPAYVDEPAAGQIVARCGRGSDHEAPDPNCTCGIYACERPESLVTMLRAAEGTLGASARAARRGLVDAWVLSSRVVLIRGTLRHALPVADSRYHEIRPLYTDDYSFTEALVHTALGGTREIACYTVSGDPPGTWRGASFTAEHAVIMTFPGDRTEDYQNMLPCKNTIVTAAGPDDVLSARLKRHADSGSTDHRWWRQASTTGRQW